MKSITVGELKQACEGLGEHESVKMQGGEPIIGTRQNFGLELESGDAGLKERLKALVKSLDELVTDAYTKATEGSKAEKQFDDIGSIVDSIAEELE